MPASDHTGPSFSQTARFDSPGARGIYAPSPVRHARPIPATSANIGCCSLMTKPRTISPAPRMAWTTLSRSSGLWTREQVPSGRLSNPNSFTNLLNSNSTNNRRRASRSGGPGWSASRSTVRGTWASSSVNCRLSRACSACSRNRAFNAFSLISSRWASRFSRL